MKLDLKQFGWKKGDYGTAAQALSVEMDIDRVDPNAPEYKIMCVNTFTENLNYLTEQWADMCNAGAMSTAMVGLDPEFSGEMVIKFDESSADLAAIRHDVTRLNNIPVQITNTLLSEVISFKAAMASFEITYEANALIKASFSVKPVTLIDRQEVVAPN